MTPTNAEGCRPPAAGAVLAKLRQQRVDWQQRFHLVEIGVFGSVARGEQQPGSDIDIWVRFDPLTPYATIHLKQELETLLESPVDVVRLREQMNPALRQHILNEGLRA